MKGSFCPFQPTIFKIDTKTSLASIAKVIRVIRQDGIPAQQIAIEGIMLEGNGGLYVLSGEIGLPTKLMPAERRLGFEATTKVGDTLCLAVQREWADAQRPM